MTIAMFSAAMRLLKTTLVAASILAVSLAICNGVCISAQPLEFPRVEEFTLRSGVRVFLIPNKRLTEATVRIQFGGGESLDPSGKEGTARLWAKLLTPEASETMPNATPNTSLILAAVRHDACSITAQVPVSSLSVYITALAGTLLPPTFEQTSFMRSTFENAKGKLQREVLAAPVEKKLVDLGIRAVYGETHYLARRATERSINAITLADVQTLHRQLLAPANITLAIVGNVSKSTLVPLLNTAFGFPSGDPPGLPKTPIQPLDDGVYLIQTTAIARLLVTLVGKAPVLGDADYDAFSLAQTLLRYEGESAFWYPEGVWNITAKPSDVPELDSAILSLQSSLKRASEAVNEKTLAIAKERLITLFRYKLGSAPALAELIQMADLKVIPLKNLQTYSKRIAALTPANVQAAVAKYMNPRRMYTVAAGISVAPASPMEQRLKPFGEVFRHSAALESMLVLDSADISLDTLLARHTLALGGAEPTATVRSLKMRADVQLSTMAQKFPGVILTKQELPDKIMRKLEIPATMISQELWFDGVNAFDKIEMMGQEQPVTKRSPKDTESAAFDAQIFPALTMQSCGFRAELLGKKNGHYVVKASTDIGTVKTMVFNGKTFLLNSIEETRQTPQGMVKVVQEFREYERVGNLNLPSVIVLKSGPGTLIGKARYEVNPVFSSGEFTPRQ
jgi:predicted Zn-dependent peptidase